MTKADAIDIIKSECYVFNPLNFDRSTMVNTALDMAVQALEQEPFEDAVSRQAVLDIWHTSYSNNREENEEIQYKKIAFELPSVKPQYTEEEIQKIQDLEQAQLEKAYELGKAEQTKWIPVSERMPEEEGDYLTTVNGIISTRCEILTFTNNLYKVDKDDFCAKKRPGWYFFDYEYGYIEETDVVAWMPLPELYNAKSKS